MKPIGPALLPDCELVFNYRSVLRAGGALNIRERKGHFVHGALFEVTELGWEVLDIKESVAKGCYTRIEHMAITRGGRPVPVTTYQVTPQRQEGFVPPSDEYAQIVSRGLKSFGLPSTQLEKAARNQPSEPDAEGDARRNQSRRNPPARPGRNTTWSRARAVACDCRRLSDA
jgi:hypothetical protein